MTEIKTQGMVVVILAYKKQDIYVVEEAQLDQITVKKNEEMEKDSIRI